MKPLDKVKEFLGRFSKRTLAIAGGAALAIVVGAVIAASVLNHKSYQSLFSGLNETEAQEIMAKLQESEVAYQYRNGEILVDSKLVDRTKAALVSEGYPKSGFTYDVFTNNTGLMSTDFDKRTQKIFQLQERIAATIRCFEGVEDAKVTIAVGEEQRYVLTDQELTDTSASVMVTMKDGQMPSPEMVRGIQSLVSKSIPNVTIDNVAVIDGLGNDVTPNDGDDATSMGAKRAELERQYEEAVETKVKNMLLPFYGPGNVRVSAKATVNMEQVVRERINYTAPDEDRNSGYVSRQQLAAEANTAEGAAAGVPGADTNADITDYGTANVDEEGAYYSRSSDTDYLLNQVKEQGQDFGGTLEDMTISVAINETELTRLSEDQIRGMVARTAGISQEEEEAKITIVNAEFFVNPDLPPNITGGKDTEWKVYLAKYLPLLIAAAAALILAILVLVFMGRKKQGRMAREAQQLILQLEDENRKLVRQEEGMALSYDLAADMENQPESKATELISTIREFSNSNPEIAAQLLKTWLRGGEGNAG